MTAIARMAPRPSVFWRFFTRRYPPPKYVFYVSLLIAAVLTTLGATPSAPDVVLGWVGLFALLFFYRVVDEVKDLPYDREFNPRRPVVTGEVSSSDIRAYLVGSGAVALAASASIGAVPLLVAAGAMACSLLLFATERGSARFADSMWGNIVVTIQLKTLLVLYAVSVGGPFPGSTALVVASFVFGYLHWEIARKTVRRDFERPGEKTYSTAAGALGASAVSLGLLLAACAAQALVAPDWRAAVLLAPVPITVWGLVRLARTRSARYSPGNPALLAYVVFLAACVVRAVL